MGQVGLGCVSAILNQDLCGTLAMIDISKQKLEGEARDFQQGSAFHQTTTILASDQYDVSEGSDVSVCSCWPYDSTFFAITFYGILSSRSPSSIIFTL